ncbi:MAG TPA: PIN domain-containing protein [Tepidisphaeraceae bacterium]|nr:PIN domain-containing protein [Tepidisphaeraceae bacterium]
MNHVLDACAMIAYLRDEPGADMVEDLLTTPGDRCYAHAVNICEVFYDFVRIADRTTAGAAVRDLRRVGVVVRPDIGSTVWERVGELKGTLARIALADCFAVALAERLGADVVTSDHHEFDRLATAGVCRVRFIR